MWGRIVVLEQRWVVETGSHAEAVAKGELPEWLARLQFGV